MSATIETFHFGNFTLDLDRRALLVAGATVLGSSRALDILEFLVRCADRVLSREEIVANVWQGLTVSDGNLAVQMHMLRRVLAEHSDGAELIATYPGRGYRFVGDFGSAEIKPGSQADVDGPQLELAEPASAHGWRHGRAPVAALFALALVLIAVVALTWQRSAPQAPRLSIAVLPFRNLSDDHAQDYLADAISDDLTTDLAHIPGSVVIARESADSYKGRPVPAQQIGRALNVRYLLEGSLRAEDGVNHINAQLIDAETGAHIWAERFDAERGQMTNTRDMIVRKIGTSAGFQLEHLENTRSLNDRPDDPDALDLFLRARAILDWDDSLSGFSTAQHLLEQAVAKQPQFGDALAELGWMLLHKAQAVDDPDGNADYAEAKSMITRALQVAPANAKAIAARGRQLLIDGKCSEAQYSAGDALNIEPSSVEAHTVLAVCAWREGRLNEAEQHLQAILRLNPDSPTNKPRYMLLAHIRLLQHRPIEAVALLQRILSGEVTPGQGSPAMGRAEFARILLMSAYGLEGNYGEAKALYRQYAEIWPNRSVWRVAEYYSAAMSHAESVTAVLAALRTAGMPQFADQHGVDSQDGRCSVGDYSPTPHTIAGGAVIDTDALAKLLDHTPHPLIVDVGRGVAALSGAVILPVDTTDPVPTFVEHTVRDRFGLFKNRSVVVMSDGPFGCAAFLAASHLISLGYSDVAWYRGGEEAWAASGRPSEDQRPF